MLYHIPNPHGGDLYTTPVQIDFSANINPYGTPQSVKDAVAEAASQLLHYPDPYCRELVAAIAAYEQVPQSQILCGNGAAELIFSYCAALAPRKAMVLAPTFSEYETALAAAGCAAVPFTLREEDNFAVSSSILDAIAAFDGDLVMLCNPNNPTGQVIAKELMVQIAALCRDKGIALFVDECFLDLTEGGEALSCKDLLADAPEIFILKAFTKSYGMAGLRLGYCLCSSENLLQKMAAAVQPWNVSIPAQKAGAAALREQDFLAKANETIRQERRFLTYALEKLGLRVIPSATNYILFFSEKELKAPLLDRGILIRSCANYHGLGEGWYRIAVKLPEENRQLINAMEEIIHG